MTDQLTTGAPRPTELSERFVPGAPAPLAPLALLPVDAPHWTQHPAQEFPHRTRIEDLCRLEIGDTADWKSALLCAEFYPQPGEKVKKVAKKH